MTPQLLHSEDSFGRVSLERPQARLFWKEIYLISCNLRALGRVSKLTGSLSHCPSIRDTTTNRREEVLCVLQDSHDQLFRNCHCNLLYMQVS